MNTAIVEDVFVYSPTMRSVIQSVIPYLFRFVRENGLTLHTTMYVTEYTMVPFWCNEDGSYCRQLPELRFFLVHCARS